MQTTDLSWLILKNDYAKHELDNWHLFSAHLHHKRPDWFYGNIFSLVQLPKEKQGFIIEKGVSVNKYPQYF